MSLAFQNPATQIHNEANAQIDNHIDKIKNQKMQAEPSQTHKQHQANASELPNHENAQEAIKIQDSKANTEQKIISLKNIKGQSNQKIQNQVEEIIIHKVQQPSLIEQTNEKEKLKENKQKLPYNVGNIKQIQHIVQIQKQTQEPKNNQIVDQNTIKKEQKIQEGNNSMTQKEDVEAHSKAEAPVSKQQRIQEKDIQAENINKIQLKQQSFEEPIKPTQINQIVNSKQLQIPDDDKIQTNNGQQQIIFQQQQKNQHQPQQEKKQEANVVETKEIIIIPVQQNIQHTHHQQVIDHKEGKIEQTLALVEQPQKRLQIKLQNDNCEKVMEVHNQNEVQKVVQAQTPTHNEKIENRAEQEYFHDKITKENKNQYIEHKQQSNKQAVHFDVAIKNETKQDDPLQKKNHDQAIMIHSNEIKNKQNIEVKVQQGNKLQMQHSHLNNQAIQDKIGEKQFPQNTEIVHNTNIQQKKQIAIVEKQQNEAFAQKKDNAQQQAKQIKRITRWPSSQDPVQLSHNQLDQKQCQPKQKIQLQRPKTQKPNIKQETILKQPNLNQVKVDNQVQLQKLKHQDDSLLKEKPQIQLNQNEINHEVVIATNTLQQKIQVLQIHQSNTQLIVAPKQLSKDKQQSITDHFVQKQLPATIKDQNQPALEKQNEALEEQSIPVQTIIQEQKIENPSAQVQKLHQQNEHVSNEIYASEPLNQEDHQTGKSTKQGQKVNQMVHSVAVAQLQEPVLVVQQKTHETQLQPNISQGNEQKTKQIVPSHYQQEHLVNQIKEPLPLQNEQIKLEHAERQFKQQKIQDSNRVYHEKSHQEQEQITFEPKNEQKLQVIPLVKQKQQFLAFQKIQAHEHIQNTQKQKPTQQEHINILNANNNPLNNSDELVFTKNEEAQELQRHKYRLNTQKIENSLDERPKQTQIVQFIQFNQEEKHIPETLAINEKQQQQKNNTIPTTKQDHVSIMTFEPLKIEQKHNGKPLSIKTLKEQIDSKQSPALKQTFLLKQGIGRISKKNFNQKRVHDVIEDLKLYDKKQPKKQTRPSSRRRTIDSSKLEHISLKSNIISVTIGELLSKNEEVQADKLLGQIDELKKKLIQLEKRKQLTFNESQKVDKYQKDTIQTNKSNKKLYTGKIYRRADSNNSRVSQEVQTLGTHTAFMNSATVSSAPRQRFSLTQDFSAPKTAAKQPQFDNKTGPILFRVKKNNKTMQGPFDFNLNEKEAGFIKSKQFQSEDKCFQARRQDLQNLQFTEEDKLNLIQKPSQRSLTFQEDFKQEVDRFFIPLGNELPKKDWAQQQLVQTAKETFRKFGVNIQLEKHLTLSVKKYKNCVSFILDNNRTILWYYEGKFYFGGWRTNRSGEGQKNGWGYDYSPGRYVYSGTFFENKRDGYGVIKLLTRQNDIIYEGSWKNGFKHGIGKQREADETEYIGEWNQGKKNGKGKIKGSDKEYFQGSFINGVKNGQGVEHFKNGDTYQGNYYDGKFHGMGVYIWVNLSKYEGQFKEGSRNGNGIWVSNHTDENCDKYEGQYKNDRKNGFGVYRWKDGTVYEGQFLNDLKHGQGIVSYGDGKSTKLQWLEGNVVTRQNAQKPRVGVKRSISKSSSKKTEQKNSQTKAPLIKFNINSESKSRPTRLSYGIEQI